MAVNQWFITVGQWFMKVSGGELTSLIMLANARTMAHGGQQLVIFSDTDGSSTMPHTYHRWPHH